MGTNRIAIPGFTATAALSVRRGNANGNPNGSIATGERRGQVVPQYGRHLDVECYRWCMFYGGSRQECFRGCSSPVPV
jgi:hypothetical protein